MVSTARHLDHFAGRTPSGDAERGQQDVIDFLSDAASHGPDAGAVERIETHGAHVFLVGDFAYKLKRAVHYPYLDFSTVEKRAWACRREVSLNRRTAPELYLDAVPVTRLLDGELALGGSGEVVDWVVRMRRFPQSGLFDHLARTDGISFALCRALARKVAAFHAIAPASRGPLPDTDPSGQRAVAEGNLSALRMRPDLFPRGAVEALAAETERHLRHLEPMLRQRVAAGFQRHCHGDLHLRNICLVDGEPVLFDCLEFDDTLATVDVLYDLAFLLMDMDEHGLAAEANAVLNHYLERTGEASGLACLPLFLSQRAAIRAKVAGDTEMTATDPARKATLAAEAREYLGAALGYGRPERPVLVCVGGLSGSGKTRLSRALAPHLAPVPGAVHLRSDQIRKTMFGHEETDRLPPECYAPEASERVYATLFARAEALLRAGRSVILDAVFDRLPDRLTALALGDENGVPARGFWLEAPRDLLKQRVAARRGDASDATPAVVDLQARRDPGSIAWYRLDTSGDHAEAAARAVALLDAAGLTKINQRDERTQ